MATGMTGVPGSNPSGSQTTVGVDPNTTAAIGGTSNPLQNMTAMPTGTSGVPSISALGALNPSGTTTQTGTNAQGGNIGGLGTSSIVEAFRKAGYSSGDAYLIAQFLEGGAGYNPQVAQALIAALGPSIQAGQANIMEQFSAEGLRSSSPAAYGLGSFDAQVTLDEGQILSQLYEQSVQNYMDVLLGGKAGQPNALSGLGAIMGGAGSAIQGVSNLVPQGGGSSSTPAVSTGSGSYSGPTSGISGPDE
jgi:hypothetical protein